MDDIPDELFDKDTEDFLNLRLDCKGPPVPPKFPHPLTLKDAGENETWVFRMYRMLRPISLTCKACTMCDLGRKMHEQNSRKFDPHVFSNMNPSKFVVVGQNPGFNECIEDQPFVGESGKFFNKIVEENGLARRDFYISNCVRCHTMGNESPNNNHKSKCEPFLRLEIGLLNPSLVITLGAHSFDVFCPDKKLSDSLGTIVESEKFGVKVYPIYHPSPRNMSNGDRKDKFIADVSKLCRLIQLLRSRESSQ